LFLHGGCNIEERRDMVQKFQNDNAVNIFILSLKAAGTGLNLTAANHVIHFDLWWNPAVEAQATDRAYRIGQHQNVIVHRFITQNTFEEKIDNIIQQKKVLANLTVATGESWISRFSNEELKELFKY
ncbi:MAG: SWF/SNF helicase family protein, partial [Bacteroidales bacterium]|nr:SWF/SNF helicase family protein [Bacteroidales bacterium]